jgi:hypothetical protein
MKFYAYRSSTLAQLAETQAATGEYAEALATVEQGVQTSPDELYFRPELLRLRGELRLRADAEGEVRYSFLYDDLTRIDAELSDRRILQAVFDGSTLA